MAALNFFFQAAPSAMLEHDVGSNDIDIEGVWPTPPERIAFEPSEQCWRQDRLARVWRDAARHPMQSRSAEPSGIEADVFEIMHEGWQAQQAEIEQLGSAIDTAEPKPD